MANWRSRVRLPVGLDKGIRNFAVKNGLTLKDAVQAMIDDGVAEIRTQGGDYLFTYDAVWEAEECAIFEYVIDVSYNAAVDSVTAAVPGRGKGGKALAETILIGARVRGLI